MQPFNWIGETCSWISNAQFKNFEPYLRKNVFDKSRKSNAVFELPDQEKVDINE
jgi:hypothetical protein